MEEILTSVSGLSEMMTPMTAHHRRDIGAGYLIKLRVAINDGSHKASCSRAL